MEMCWRDTSAVRTPYNVSWGKGSDEEQVGWLASARVGVPSSGRIAAERASHSVYDANANWEAVAIGQLGLSVGGMANCMMHQESDD